MIFIQGAFPENRKCRLCQSYVVDVDAVWDSGQPFHERCYVQYLANEIERFEKKMRYGNLTIADAKELQELKDLHKKMRTQIFKDISPSMKPDSPIFKGNTPLALYSAGHSKKHNNLLPGKEAKLLKESCCDTHASTGVF